MNIRDQTQDRAPGRAVPCRRMWIRAAMICLLAACRRAEMAHGPPGVQVADSIWVSVDGPTLIAFHPLVSNDSLEADQDLATALDDLAFHLSGVIDSLEVIGFHLVYHGGDTVWLRTGARQDRIVRHPDSANIGYVFADTGGRSAVLYGVRTGVALLEYAREFRGTGAPRPRP